MCASAKNIVLLSATTTAVLAQEYVLVLSQGLAGALSSHDNKRCGRLEDGGRVRNVRGALRSHPKARALYIIEPWRKIKSCAKKSRETHML